MKAFERTLRFVTENSDELATVDPFYLPNICITLLNEHNARFIAVYAPDNEMRTVFVAHYNPAPEGGLHLNYTYCFFDGSQNKHLEQYR